MEFNENKLVQLNVTEYRTNDVVTHEDFYFRIEYKMLDKQQEMWGFLCDKWGFKYFYSLPLYSSRYGDGYLNKSPDDWYACAGGMGYNKLVVKKDDLINAINELRMS